MHCKHYQPTEEHWGPKQKELVNKINEIIDLATIMNN
jgi:hypothetical protein